jgi:toxin CcdB
MGPRQFDIFANPDPASAESCPYFVVLQANMLSHLNTRIVAPLVSKKVIPLFERLMPELKVGDRAYVVDVTNLGVIPTRALGRRLTSCESDGDKVKSAIDLVFLGI